MGWLAQHGSALALCCAALLGWHVPAWLSSVWPSTGLVWFKSVQRGTARALTWFGSTQPGLILLSAVQLRLTQTSMVWLGTACPSLV